MRLPQSITETSILAVFAQGSAAEEARKAGADLVLGPEEIPLVAQGRYEFAKTLAHPATFPALVKIARWLGPRGLMPSLKQGTVTENLVQAIQDSKGRMDYKADKKNVLHTGIAKVKFTDAQIKENIEYLLQEILNSHVQGSKVSRNNYIKSVHLCTTNGPGLLLSLDQFY